MSHSHSTHSTQRRRPAPPTDGLRWWIVAVLLLGSAGASFVAMRQEPVYIAEGSLWVETGPRTGRVSDEAPLPPAQHNAWVELLRSRQVLEPVAARAGVTVGDLSDRVAVRLDPTGNFMAVSFRDTDPRRAASITNALMDRHVELAAELKARRMTELLEILRKQLGEVEQDLARAEQDLEDFRVEAAESELASVTARPDVRSIARRETERTRRLRRVRAVDALYDDLRRRVEAADLASRSMIPDVRMLDRATVPARPATDGRLWTAVAFLVGLLGVVVVGVRSTGRLVERRTREDGSVPEGRMEDLLPILAIVSGALLALLLTSLIGR